GGAVVARPSVEQAADVGMAQAREDLPLRVEAPQHRIGVDAALDDLDRDLLLELTVGAARQVDVTHPTCAQVAHDLVRTEPLADPPFEVVRDVATGLGGGVHPLDRATRLPGADVRLDAHAVSTQPAFPRLNADLTAGAALAK